MKKILFAIAVFFIAISNTLALDLYSRNAILYNLNDNKVIYTQNEKDITSIASLTKIMTTLVAIEHIDNYENKVTIDSNMLKGLKEANAAVAGLKVGQKVTYNDLLYATFLASGADATRALSISLAGSEEEFVKLMNAKAKELGLVNTNFTNTTGLDQKGQTSTVEEVATLLIKALENEKFKEIFYTKSYTLSTKTLTVYSTLFKTAEAYKVDSSYFVGGKTGYTDDAGRCLASIGYDKENDITYLLVTTQADPKSKSKHVIDAYEVYKYYSENFKYHNLVDVKDLLISIPTKYAKVDSVSFYADKDMPVYLENTFDKKDVKLEYVGLDILKHGLKKGDKVGKITVSYNDIEYGNIDVILNQDIEFSLLVFIKENIVIVVSSALALILIITFIIIKKNKKRRKK